MIKCWLAAPYPAPLLLQPAHALAAGHVCLKPSDFRIRLEHILLGI